MRKFPIVLDLETQHTFRDFADPKKLGISVAVIYDYSDNQSKIFFENELSKLFPILENASYIIGYNIRSFDLPVLQAYYPGDTTQFALFDMIEDIREKIGRRLALNDLISATLNKKKSGHGLMAIDYFKNKEWDKLKQYCLDDVMATKELFEYGVNNKQIYYLDVRGKVVITVDWKKYLEEEKGNDVSLTLPF